MGEVLTVSLSQHNENEVVVEEKRALSVELKERKQKKDVLSVQNGPSTPASVISNNVLLEENEHYKSLLVALVRESVISACVAVLKVSRGVLVL